MKRRTKLTAALLAALMLAGVLPVATFAAAGSDPAPALDAAAEPSASPAEPTPAADAGEEPAATESPVAAESPATSETTSTSQPTPGASEPTAEPTQTPGTAAEPEATPTGEPAQTPGTAAEPETTPTGKPAQTPGTAAEPEATPTGEPAETSQPTTGTSEPTAEPTATPETTPTASESPEETAPAALEMTPTGEPTATPEATPAPDISTELVEGAPDYSFSRLGFWVGGDYFSLIEEDPNRAKGVMPISLLPLDTVELKTMDFSGYLPSQLSELTLDALAPDASADGQIMMSFSWSGEDIYFPVESGETISLFDHSFFDVDGGVIVDYGNGVEVGELFFESGKEGTITIISGPDPQDQLNLNNKKYVVHVKFPKIDDLFTCELFSADGDQIRKSSGEYWEWPSNSAINETFIVATSSTKPTISGKVHFNENNAMGVKLVSLTIGYYKDGEEWVSIPVSSDGIIPAEYFHGIQGGVLSGKPVYDDSIGRATDIYALVKKDVNDLNIEYDLHIQLDCFISDTLDYTDDPYYDIQLYDESGKKIKVITDWAVEGTSAVYRYIVPEGAPVNGKYTLKIEGWHSNGEPWTDATPDDLGIEKIVVGYYETLKDTEGQPDIKDTLCGEGYKADYSRPVDFTEFGDGFTDHYRVQTVSSRYVEYMKENELPFTISGVKAGSEGNTKKDCSVRVFNSDEEDGLGDIYQTVYLLLDGKPVPENTTIYPEFSLPTGDNVFLGADTSGQRQESGVSSISFENGKSYQYTVASRDGKTFQNYFVTFVTPQTGAKLHVLGDNVRDSNYDKTEKLPVRELHFGDVEWYSRRNGDYIAEGWNRFFYDILVTNVGDEELTGLKATLVDAQNVLLDSYWSLGGTGKLAPFSADKVTENGQVNYDKLANQAKIRLLPETDEYGRPVCGDISGYLVISSENGGQVKIKLTGASGLPSITTETLVPGVKYVPYDTMIQSDYVGSAAAGVIFRAEGEGLPEGISLRENGELYGIPMESGTFEFQIGLYSQGGTLIESMWYTLEIAQNTDDNVWNASDEGYDVLNYIGVPAAGGGGALDGSEHYVLYSYSQQVFRSQGEYQYFTAFYLDGKKLTDGRDYKSSEGSTVITIFEQTLRQAGEGTHTIAAEFHELKDPSGLPMGTLKRTSQNYTVSLPAEPTPTPRNDIDLMVYVQDPEGDPEEGDRVDIHSTPQSATTSGNGAVFFRYIDFGTHTLAVAVEDENSSASMWFNLVRGESAGLSGNTVTARAGSTVALTVEFDGKNLRLLSAVATNPPTGDRTNLGRTAGIAGAAMGVFALLTAAPVAVKAAKRRKGA